MKNVMLVVLGGGLALVVRSAMAGETVHVCTCPPPPPCAQAAMQAEAVQYLHEQAEKAKE